MLLASVFFDHGRERQVSLNVCRRQLAVLFRCDGDLDWFGATVDDVPRDADPGFTSVINVIGVSEPAPGELVEIGLSTRSVLDHGSHGTALVSPGVK